MREHKLRLAMLQEINTNPYSNLSTASAELNVNWWRVWSDSWRADVHF
uniref:Trp operon leader peptide n=1 Tax=Vibrio ziniensis TaxID=2711221 RepID=A0A6G7CM85_9VIBR|nr:Trp operon leader peptide [Vibrio ziniensis]